MNGLRLEIARGPGGLEGLAPDWAALSQSLPDPSYVQLWGWHRSLVEALVPEPEEVAFCVLRDAAGAAVAIVPLLRTRQRMGGVPVRVLQLPSHEHMHHTDLLVHPGWRTRIELPALMARVAAQGLAFDVLVLGPVLADSTARAIFESGKPLLALVEPARQSDALATGNHEQLLDRLSKNFRGNLRKARNKLERLGTVRMVTARGPELGGAFDRFCAVEASGWKGREGTGTAIANDPRLLRFYRQLIERLGPAGQVEIHLLLAGGTVIAAQFAVVVGRRCYLLKIGYDEGQAALAPGNMLLERLLQRYERDAAVSHVDLVTDAAWHESWKPESRLVYQHHLFRPTTRGLLAWAALQGKQALRPVRRRVGARWRELIGAEVAGG